MNVALIGVGGYGRTYLNLLTGPLKDRPGCRFVAAADPFLKIDQVPMYDRIEDCFAHEKIDLAIISTPIHLHEPQVVFALEQGAHVLCEKPLVPTRTQLDRLERKAAETGKMLVVGFQHAFSESMQALKQRIHSGALGHALQLKTYVSWPRGWKYFSRSWAGKMKAENGDWIRDSILSNATAHYLQNMLFLLGADMDTSLMPEHLSAEVYRANGNIESFDTVALRCSAGDTEILFYASHAVNFLIEPAMFFRFENATITLNYFNQDFECVIHYRDGRIEKLGHLLGNGEANKVAHTLDAIAGGGLNICSCKTVRPFTAVIDAVFDRTAFYDFDPSVVVKDSDAQLTYVRNLHMDLHQCFAQGKLPNELGLRWAKPASNLF